MAVVPLPVATVCFLMELTAVVTNFTISAPASVFMPNLTQYLGRFTFLTVQSNFILTGYFGFATACAAVGGGSSSSRKLDAFAVRTFPLVFSLGAFLTFAYYGLDHFNPAQVAAREALAADYPYVEWSAHGEHALALPAVVLFLACLRLDDRSSSAKPAKPAAAAPAPLTPPSRADVVRWVGGYLALYLTQTHLNKWATGEWVYPILEDVTRAGGASARNAFFAVLVTLFFGLASLARYILAIPYRGYARRATKSSGKNRAD